MNLLFKNYYLLIVGVPFLGLIINTLFLTQKPVEGSRISTFAIWVGFIGAIAGWIVGVPYSNKTGFWGFKADELSWVIATLILFVSGIVHHFSLRYMAGDRNYRRYFLFLTTVSVSALIMVMADHLMLFMAAWATSNLILVLLMIHKSQWRAAKNSGILALKTFTLGFVFLAFACWLLADASGTFSLHMIMDNRESLPTSISMIALLLIMLAAITQSAGWPFHRWLLSSLNSPTPVSSLMHAGLVNGGGFLLARFALLYLEQHMLLNILFLVGIITAVLGTVWKLIQNDIKRMLACSTMGQMGFMIMQCGLGLFPAAVAHLCWHGLFKAFLFLGAGAAVQKVCSRNKEKAGSIPLFLVAGFCGVIGAYGFAIASKKSFIAMDTSAILIGFAFMASAQFAFTILDSGKFVIRLILAIVMCLITGGLYGASIHLIELVLPLSISVSQTLNLLHISVFSLVFLIWLAVNLKLMIRVQNSLWWKRFYVRILNSSQPHPTTVTSTRKEYQY